MPSVWNEEKSYFEAKQSEVFTSEKEKNDWKVFLLDWLQPNIQLSALQKIHCPSIIISGDHDLIRLEHTLIIYQNIPTAQLWVLPNSSHGTLIEYPFEFSKKKDEFFAPSIKK